MSRYCKQCGQELVQQAQFCPKCGILVEGGGNTKGKKVVIGSVIAILSAVIMIITICLIVTSMNAYKKPFKYLEEGMNTRNVETILKAFPSGTVRDEEIYELMQEILEYPSILTGKVEILDKKKIDKQYLLSLGYDLEYLNSLALSNKGYLVTARISEIEDGSYTNSEISEIPVFKIDGKWVLLSLNF